MQRIFDSKCSPKEYQQQGKEYPYPDLTKELCPQCQASFLKLHGFYVRWLCAEDFSGYIFIRRYICKECGKTVSLLPSFAHPRMGPSIEFILGVLRLFYLEALSVAKTVQTFWKLTGLLCSRQLFRQIRVRFEGNLHRLVMEIIAWLKLELPPVTAPNEEKRKRARQFLEYIHSFDPKDVSLKLFERSGTTFLTSLSN